MPAVTLNAVSFAGSVHSDPATVRWAPRFVTPKPRKIGVDLEMADGTPILILHWSTPPYQKVDQELKWEKVVAFTRDAVRATFDLATTFSATVPAGTATYQCGKEDYEEDEFDTLPDGTKLYNVTLMIRQT